MGANTVIEWADHTLNFWMGCEPVSEGCDNCYAARGLKRWGHDPHERRQVSKATIKKTLRFAEEGDVIFVNSWSDFFDPEVSHDWRRVAWEVFDARRDLIFLLLTKRPEQIEPTIAATCPHGIGDAWSHVRLGVTAENQLHWDKRVGELMRIDWPGKKFVSCEPLLGEIDADSCDAGQAIGPCDECGESRANPNCEACVGLSSIDWVIAGGESGPNARPAHPGWFRGLRDQCDEGGVPFHFKQWGEYIPMSVGAETCKSWAKGEIPLNADGTDCRGCETWVDGSCVLMRRVGKKKAGRMLDGRTWDEVPE